MSMEHIINYLESEGFLSFGKFGTPGGKISKTGTGQFNARSTFFRELFVHQDNADLRVTVGSRTIYIYLRRGRYHLVSARIPTRDPNVIEEMRKAIGDARRNHEAFTGTMEDKTSPMG